MRSSSSNVCLLGAASGVFDLSIRTSMWDSPDHTQREKRLLLKEFVAAKMRIMITNIFFLGSWFRVSWIMGFIVQLDNTYWF
jgi:hypothetical protein